MERFTIDENNYVRDAMNGGRICGPRMKRRGEVDAEAAKPGDRVFTPPTRDEAEAWANTANEQNERAVKIKP